MLFYKIFSTRKLYDITKALSKVITLRNIYINSTFYVLSSSGLYVKRVFTSLMAL